MASPLRIWIHGFDGRMGQELQTAIAQWPDVRFVGGHNHKQMVIDNFVKELDPKDVKKNIQSETDILVDFSLPEGTQQLLKLLLALQKPPATLICTTGLSNNAFAKISALSKKTAVSTFFNAP